jgi:polyphosphate kinase
MPGVSEHITVRSIVGRFLEHSRILYFENGCRPEVYVGSADWMPRNFFRRIELVFPIEDGVLRDRIKRDILDVQLADTAKARLLQANGSYVLAKPAEGAAPRCSQSEFIALANDGTRTWRRNQKPRRKYPEVRLLPSPFKKQERR